METINDIVAEMRKDIPRVIDTKIILRNYADRIEAAMKAECEELHKRIKLWSDRADELRKKCDEQYAVIKQDLTTEKSSPVDNAAKMREALRAIRYEMFKDSGMGACTKLHTVIDTLTQAALSAPARNCDLYSHEEALRIWRSLPESEENGCFDEWLFAEAKESLNK